MIQTVKLILLCIYAYVCGSYSCVVLFLGPLSLDLIVSLNPQNRLTLAYGLVQFCLQLGLNCLQIFPFSFKLLTLFFVPAIQLHIFLQT